MWKQNDNILNQEEFVRRLAGSEGISQDEALRWFHGVKKELIACLLDGLGVRFRGLGVFKLRKRAARRQPNNAICGGQQAYIKPMTVVHLTPSSKLNRAITKTAKMREEN